MSSNANRPTAGRRREPRGQVFALRQKRPRQRKPAQQAPPSAVGQRAQTLAQTACDAAARILSR